MSRLGDKLVVVTAKPVSCHQACTYFIPGRKGSRREMEGEKGMRETGRGVDTWERHIIHIEIGRKRASKSLF